MQMCVGWMNEAYGEGAQGEGAQTCLFSNRPMGIY